MTTESDSQNSLDWKVLANRNVEMQIGRGLKKPINLDFPPHVVSLFVSGALMAAHKSFEMLEETGEEPQTIDQELPAVPIKKVGLARSNLDGYKTLILEVGEAHVGFAIPDDALSELGRLLLSLDEGGPEKS